MNIEEYSKRVLKIRDSELIDLAFDKIEETEDYVVYLAKDKLHKVFFSPNANYVFNTSNGDMYMWGKSFEEDPIIYPVPNILDLEITDICKGTAPEDEKGDLLGKFKVCPFCYKANLPTNKGNMSFETFKKIFDKLPKSITQIAFGADSTLTTNSDVWKMMDYCRENFVVPNITVAQITDEVADLLANKCGAVAVSLYDSKNACYNSVKRLTDRGMSQVNIHCMLSEETFKRAFELLDDVQIDERLKKLRAVVFLSLKKKGRGTGYKVLSQEKFTYIVKRTYENKLSVGFDSCSSLKALRAYREIGLDVSKYVIPCESSLLSSYINLEGDFYPCSFTENTEGWEKGVSVVDCEDFYKDVWMNEKVINFRNNLLHTCKGNDLGCRSCPIYEV